MLFGIGTVVVCQVADFDLTYKKPDCTSSTATAAVYMQILVDPNHFLEI